MARPSKLRSARLIRVRVRDVGRSGAVPWPAESPAEWDKPLDEPGAWSEDLDSLVLVLPMAEDAPAKTRGTVLRIPRGEKGGGQDPDDLWSSNGETTRVPTRRKAGAPASSELSETGRRAMDDVEYLRKLDRK